jgi:ABC-type sugar transport system permease subunit
VYSTGSRVALTLSETATQPVKPSARLLQDDLFWSSFRTGLIWAFGVTGIQFLLALLRNAGVRFQWLVRPLALVPWAMPSVIVAILGNLIYQPDAGLLNDAADEAAFGLRRTALGDLQSAPRIPLEVG